MVVWQRMERQMKLYIRFGSLSKFQRLFDSNEYLQDALTRHSAVKWEIAEGEEERVREILRNRGFNFEIA